MRFFVVVALLAWSRPVFCQQGTVTGRVVDTTGNPVAHVQVVLSMDNLSPEEQTESTEDGAFSFSNIGPGPYRLSFTAPGFDTKTIAVEVRMSQPLVLQPTVLAVAALAIEVHVTPPQADIARAQLKVEEQQHLIGFIPNYRVTYDPHAVPLNPAQKFELTWKSVWNPFAFGVAGFSAGIGQAQNMHRGFGGGAQGYAKRYGAAYADSVAGIVLQDTVMSMLFKEDPRYFYKGTGTKRTRLLYALSRGILCRADNMHVQTCYAAIIGPVASGFLTNLYYPAIDRNSTNVTLEYAALNIGGKALGNVFQEFVAPRLTRKKS
jgi:hypothetical protein